MQPLSSWPAALSAYAASERAAGRAPGTIRLHKHYLRVLALHTPAPGRATPEVLDAVMGAYSWAPETRKSARAAWVGFYAWAVRRGHLERSPAETLPAVHVPLGEARPAPDRVIAAALAAAPPRVRLMLQLAAFAGLRAGEIARVHSGDVDGRILLVHGKGGRERTVPLSSDLAQQISGAGGWVFPSPAGGHLTPGHVTRLVSRALPGEWTAHTLRHRLGTQAYAGTRDLLAVSRLLGHSRPETTQRYVRLPDDAVSACVDAAAGLAA